jgi:hypothetical protein
MWVIALDTCGVLPLQQLSPCRASNLSCKLLSYVYVNLFLSDVRLISVRWADSPRRYIRVMQASIFPRSSESARTTWNRATRNTTGPLTEFESIFPISILHTPRMLSALSNIQIPLRREDAQQNHQVGKSVHFVILLFDMLGMFADENAAEPHQSTKEVAKSSVKANVQWMSSSVKLGRICNRTLPTTMRVVSES